MSTIGVNPDQLKARIAELTATAGLKKALIETKERENIAHRQYLYYLSLKEIDNWEGGPGQRWCKALEDAWYAEKDLLLLEVAKLQGEIQLCEELLREAKPNPKLYVPQ